MERSLSWLQVLVLLVRRWKTIVATPLILAVAALAISFLIPPSYRSSVTFVPERAEGPRLAGALGGLVGQLGFSLGGATPNESPQFYRAVAQSREVIDSILVRPFARPGSNTEDQATLLDILRIGGSSPEERLYKGRRKFRKRLVISIDRETDIVKLYVEMPGAALAAVVVEHLFNELQAFNLQTRQSSARARREFLEGRVAHAAQELGDTEADLRDFLQRNRLYQSSPELVFENDRLNRAVQLRQELYLTLSREYEMARVEEVNDAPLLTLIEPARAPVRKSSPRRVLITVAGFAAGLALAFVIVGGQAYRSRLQQEQGDAYNELTLALRQARRQVGALFRPPEPGP